MARPKKQKSTRPLIKTGARMDSATYNALLRHAERNRRSLNAEINLRLEATLKADKALLATG
jgi:hypothetical protein